MISTVLCTTSTPCTSYPRFAKSAAVGSPIYPSPITQIFLLLALIISLYTIHHLVTPCIELLVFKNFTTFSQA